jgi:3-deoxy-D-manno-octulosonic-acid transferase
LTAQGGQNPIEPGALGKAMVFGPNMQNFEAVVSSLLTGGGAMQVKDADALESAFYKLLADANVRTQLGENARRVVRENLGAIERTVEMILTGLTDAEIYVASKRQS